MIDHHFDKVFCINLTRRPDRLAQAQDEFAKYGIRVEFVAGVDGLSLPEQNMISKDGLKVSRGDLGCTLSHLKVVRMAKEQNLKSYFVFEDDVEFAPDINAKFFAYMYQLPADWDMLYLGGNHMGGFDAVTENIAKIHLTYTTHAIGVKAKAYDALIEVLGRENDKVDICFAELHEKLNCYVTRPHLAFQRPSFSDILEKETDYQHLRK